MTVVSEKSFKKENKESKNVHSMKAFVHVNGVFTSDDVLGAVNFLCVSFPHLW